MIWEDVPEGEKLFSMTAGFDTSGKGGSVHAMQYWLAKSRTNIIKHRIDVMKNPEKYEPKLDHFNEKKNFNEVLKDIESGKSEVVKIPESDEVIVVAKEEEIEELFDEIQNEPIDSE